MRFSLVLAVLALSGCRSCGGGTVVTEAEKLRFDGAPLVFADTYLGTERALRLELTNPSRLGQTVRVAIEAPFWLEAAETFVLAGGSESLLITFRPSSAGDASATLSVGDARVEVRGVGLAIPECIAAAPCEASAFDAAQSQCLSRTRADGEACEQPCVVAGTCLAGLCVGQAQDCSDANACTVDACGAAGCQHSELSCPAPGDPCKVATCDSATGCGEVDADDGVVCGPESCLDATVPVCIQGRCEQRVRPDTGRCTNTWASIFLPASSSAGLAWDPVRNRMVRLVQRQTWLWDGAAWSQRFPPQTPPAGDWRWMATDTRRHRVVAVLNGETWEWDGSTWLLRANNAATAGFPRSHGAMAYDSVRNKVVMFGGAQAASSNYLDTTWEWDGLRWLRASPSLSPPPRAAAMMAFDPLRARVVLFGGGTPAFDELGDTWEWDGSQWTARTLSPAPTPRYSGSLTWNPQRGTVMLLGGTNYDPLDEPWEFDGVSWRRLPQTGVQVSYHGAAYDPIRQKIVVLENGSTWEWDGATFVSRRHAAPSIRDAPAAVFDEARGRVTSFGGYPRFAVNFASVDDTWQFSDGGWTELSVSPRPAPRYAAGFIYDPQRQRSVLFGGSSEINGPGGIVGQRFGDHWEWDGARWTTFTPTETPPAGPVRGATWDGARQRIVLVAVNGSYWSFDGATWVPEPGYAGPVDALVFDESTQRVMAQSDTSTYARLDGGWSVISTATLPSGVIDARMAWVPTLQRVVLQARQGTFSWDGANWVNMQPRTSPPDSAEVLLFDGTANRLMAITPGDHWVYLP